MRTTLRFRSLLASLLLLPLPAFAGDLVPRLVRDVDLTTYTAGSSPRQQTDINHGFAFTAFGNRELWVYDNTEDLFSPVLKKLEIRLLGFGIYAARDTSGWTLWTVQGFPYFQAQAFTTQPVAHVSRGYFTSTPAAGVLLFDADAGKGRGLWTVRQKQWVEIARPLPFPDGSLLHDLTIYHGRPYFVARDRHLGTALWTTDGTPAGTRPVFAPQPGKTVPVTLAGVLRDRLLLTVSGGAPALWLSDGTPRGTRRLVAIGGAHAGAAITDALGQPFAPRAYFVADDGRHGTQLWATDGTAAGTVRLTSFTADDPFAASRLAPIFLNTRLVFFADDGVHGREIWRTDGTPAGTQLLVDACAGTCGTSGQLLATLPALDTPSRPERLLFSAQAPGLGLELWATDGTAAGTGLVSDLCPGACSGDPLDVMVSYFSTAGSGASFTATTPAGLRALWFTDGTPERTWRLTPPGARVTSLSPLAVSTADFGDEFWITDGTPEGTHLWRDLGQEQDSGSHPFFLGTAGPNAERVVFTAFTPARGLSVWSTDGTAAGTQRLQVPQPGPDLSRLTARASAAGHALFAAPAHAGEGQVLWGTDGTATGVVRLAPAGVTVNMGPYAAGQRALFFGTDTENGTELWTSGGTPESTHLAVDLVPGPESPGGVGAEGILHGQLLFGRADDSHLWISDGTAAGTGRLIDRYPFLTPLDNTTVPLFAESSGTLFFLGADTVSGPAQLWVSDWTAAGTRPLGFTPDQGQGFAGLFPAGSRLFITTACADTSCVTPVRLWVGNATPGSVVQAPKAPENGGIVPPVAVGERLVFGDSSGRLWVTDGTAEGTFSLHDPAGQDVLLLDGRAVSFAGHLVAATPLAEGGFSPCYVWDGSGTAAVPAVPAAGVLCDGDFFPAGSRLYFTGFDPHTGAEPWVFEEK